MKYLNSILLCIVLGKKKRKKQNYFSFLSTKFTNYFSKIKVLLIEISLSEKVARAFAKEWFKKGDTNNDDELSLKEAKLFLPKIEKKLKKEGLAEEEFRKYFDLVDTNSDGIIQFHEFKKAVSKKMSELMERSKRSQEFNINHGF